MTFIKRVVPALPVLFLCGGCTFSQFAHKFNGVGFWLILLTIALVIVYRRKNPDRKLRIGFKKKNNDK